MELNPPVAVLPREGGDPAAASHWIPAFAGQNECGTNRPIQISRTNLYSESIAVI